MSPAARSRKSSGTRRFTWIQTHPLFGRGIPVVASASGRSLSDISPSGPARSLLIRSVSRHRRQILEALARFSSPHRLHRTSSGTPQQRTQRGRASVPAGCCQGRSSADPLQDLRGRACSYTGNDHTKESYGEPAFRSLLLGGVRYVTDRTNIDCHPEVGYATFYDGSLKRRSDRLVAPRTPPCRLTPNDMGCLTRNGGMGLYWYSGPRFTSYSLKLDWKPAGDNNSAQMSSSASGGRARL